MPLTPDQRYQETTVDLAPSGSRLLSPKSTHGSFLLSRKPSGIWQAGATYPAEFGTVVVTMRGALHTPMTIPMAQCLLTRAVDAASAAPFPTLPLKECHAFARNGVCDDGEDCDFVHVLPLPPTPKAGPFGRRESTRLPTLCQGPALAWACPPLRDNVGALEEDFETPESPWA
uniref:C3H1-type domain-containing protein n=1 Tax=Neobodo designis TaxID=312471 RepID=A0A7S1M5W3_NEODS